MDPIYTEPLEECPLCGTDDILYPSIAREYRNEVERLNRFAELEAENAKMRSALEGIRDLARTGTAPMAYNMTPEEWNKHKLNEIAAEAQVAINAVSSKPAGGE